MVEGLTADGPPARLRADYRDATIGLDRTPLLSWEPGGPQSAAEVQLGTSPQDLRLVRVPGPTTHVVPPVELTATTTYVWRVRTRHRSRWGPWSHWAELETSLMAESDWRGACWIGARGHGPAPTLSCAFDAAPGGRFRLYASGLGTVRLRLNGADVGDGVLDPPPSAYDAVIWYRTFDVSGLVAAGSNVLEAQLGRGFYAMASATSFGWHRAPWRDEPKLRAVLIDLDDPSTAVLTSQPGWVASRSAVVDDSLYTGEQIDFGAPVQRGDAVLARVPTGTLRACRQPPVTRRERVEVVRRVWTARDRQRVDLAQNVAGMVSLRSHDLASPTLLVKVGEHLAPDGAVLAADAAIEGELQLSRLARVPSDQLISMTRTYAGGRYVEVTGSEHAVDVQVDRVSSAPPAIGTFCSNDGRLDAIHRITRLTLENCLQGTPIDTPLYEKQGYTGDAQLLAETFAYNYWMPTALGSWLEGSLIPSQADDGSLPGIAPTPPGNWIFDTPSPAWDAALFEIPATLLRHYADLTALRAALPSLRRYLSFLGRRFPAGVVDVGLGDWNAPGHIVPPESPAVVSTAYYFRFLQQMATFSRRLGNDAEAAHHDSLAAAVRTAFDSAFWKGDGEYGTHGDDYRQTSNVLALAFGLARPSRRRAVVRRLVRELDQNGGHLDTGIVGTRFLLRTLSREGLSATAFEVALAPGYPGWSFWLENGATTLHERWELDGRSHDHAMFGTIDQWLYADVSGLRPGADGWACVEVDPHLPGDGTFACEAEIDTLAGPVRAAWDDHGTQVTGAVTAPPNVPVLVPDTAGVRELSRRRRRVGRRVEHLLELEVRPPVAARP